MTLKPIKNLLLITVVWALATGCRPTASSTTAPERSESKPSPSLRVLVIDDVELARAIERQWMAHGENPLQVRLLKREEFSSQEQRRLASDVVIYPSALIGELASRDRLQPLGEQDLSNSAFQWRDIWELPRLHEIRWGGKTLAVPMGSPTLMLCYRQDIFDRLALSVPTTWPAYQATLERLSKFDGVRELTSISEKDWQGGYEPLGGGWASELLLARAASYASHPSQFSTLFDYRDLKPLIDGPPFLRALDELVAAAHLRGMCSDEEWERVRKAQNTDLVRHELLQGNCAMAITWPCPISSNELKPAGFPLAFAPLPGSPDVYNFRTASWERRAGAQSTSVPILGISGRLGSIVKECRNVTAAMNLLFFLSGPELSGQISSASKHTTLFRESHLGQVDRWLGPQYGSESARSYGAVIEQSFNQPLCLQSLRIPGRHRYMAVLDEAVWASVTGKSPPREALRSAAQQWEKISDELGRDTQRSAYAQSIGLEP